MMPCFKDEGVFFESPDFVPNRVGVDNDFDSDD